ncbi:enth/vhs [Akanthomyces lecanii RCEF 1005]|uniref:Enth/vhs n=1 Tax=Akanthomyces lecanii RCEF 1005 TaxID=1081108 RepID=A0A167Q6Q8_CORDF|nr:enth/vhs [Akanthomyces lecanii RCEF 1005]
MVSAKDLETELETDLDSMLSRKAPGASRTCINRLTTLCVANVEVHRPLLIAMVYLLIQETQFEAILIPKIHARFRETPNTHKLGVLYVIDSATRGWLLQARANKQDLSRPASDGTYVAAVHRVTQLLPGLMRAMNECAPDDQKEKIRKLLDIWDAGKTFPAEILQNCRQGLTPQPHTSIPCARSEGSRRLHPLTAYTPAEKHHAGLSPSLLEKPCADGLSPAQRHQPACGPEAAGPVEHRGTSAPGGVGSIFHQKAAVLPDHAALWVSTSAALIMSQLAYLLKSGQPLSSQSKVAQWTGKDAETATSSVGSGPCLELPLQRRCGVDLRRSALNNPNDYAAEIGDPSMTLAHAEADRRRRAAATCSSDGRPIQPGQYVERVESGVDTGARRNVIRNHVQTREGGHSAFMRYRPNSARRDSQDHNERTGNPASRDEQDQGQDVMPLLLPGTKTPSNDPHMSRRKRRRRSYRSRLQKPAN